MINRRNFLKTSGMVTSTALLTPRSLWSLPHKKNDIIQSIEIYLINVSTERHFSHGTWNNRQHIIIKINSGDVSGWGEIRAEVNTPDMNIELWGMFLKEILGKDASSAFAFLESKYGIWESGKIESLELALYDIKGKIDSVPSLQLLGLTENKEVAGLFAILEKDPKKVLEKLEIAKERNLKKYIKIKLFGEEDHDRQLIELVRKNIGPDTFIIGDPNRGYKNGSLDQYAKILKGHYNAGLNGCEDPAEGLSIDNWIELQKLVDPLTLIPDHPIRPTWESINTLKPGMGKIYNFHPKTSGSLKNLVTLAKRVKGWGSDIMIGDDSIIGPVATAWQQIACGLGAVCVEALEKPEESSIFLDCIEEKSTAVNAAGNVFIKKLQPGFGLKINDKKLQSTAVKYFKYKL